MKIKIIHKNLDRIVKKQQQQKSPINMTRNQVPGHDH